MKNSIFTISTLLFIGFIVIANICNAQTHRLLSKIEETTLGNWDKVTVQLPNSTYKLNDVIYENNTVLVLFDYAKTIGAKKPSYFTFNLSKYIDNSQKISAQANFIVAAKYKDSVLRESDRLVNNLNFNSTTGGTTIGTFRCPVYCPF